MRDKILKCVLLALILKKLVSCLNQTWLWKVPNILEIHEFEIMVSNAGSSIFIGEFEVKR